MKKNEAQDIIKKAVQTVEKGLVNFNPTQILEAIESAEFTEPGEASDYSILQIENVVFVPEAIWKNKALYKKS